jgi:N-acetylglucosamine-6-phosphate deacetylase
MAPELEGALDAIRTLASRGIAVSIGHTDASYEQAMAGVAAGARMFTHVFNAMPPLHHRQPGAAGAALSESNAMAAVIADGVHLHPAMLQIVWRTRGPLGTIVTSDRVAIAGSPGAEAASPDEASVREGAARLNDGTLAGSMITMLEAVRNMDRYAHLDASGIMHAAAHNPARVLGLADRGNLQPHSHADLLLLDRELGLKAVFIGGREVA